jgi:predicted SnoaL-like aldol condensation-catalyzing enzyme
VSRWLRESEQASSPEATGRFFANEPADTPVERYRVVTESTQERNKALVLRAFDLLFNKRDYIAAELYWSAHYIQHSAHIAPGREGLFDLVKSAPSTLRYESGLILAEGEWVMVHGRFSTFGQTANWVAVDILRVQDGILMEHWDVLQDEVTEEQSKSKRPMFGSIFPSYS